MESDGGCNVSHLGARLHFFAYASRCSLGVWILLLAGASTTDTINNGPLLEVIWILTEVATLR